MRNKEFCCIINIVDENIIQPIKKRHLAYHSNIKMKIVLFIFIITGLLYCVMCRKSYKWTKPTSAKPTLEPNLEEIKEDIMQIKNQLESFENLIFSNNLTSHNVNLNAASVLKSGYSYVVSALEKFFDKGLPPPNSIQIRNSIIENKNNRSRK
uniref:Uncharacterized protein n=1 Tax=Schizaphis graminum TaxID=13262 RepID=A0A2S2PCR3_SCHGA